MQIENTLNEQQIAELFAEHSVWVRTMTSGQIPAVPIFKIVELFGPELAQWAESQIGLLPEGGMGILSNDTPQVKSPYTGNLFIVVTIKGFRSIAAEHNVRKLCGLMAHSEAAQQWEAIWNKRCNRLADAVQAQKKGASKCKSKEC